MDQSDTAKDISYTEARAQIFRVMREIKWLILHATLIAIILYWPAQMREIYRIDVAESGHWLGWVRVTFPVFLICLIVWFGAALLSVQAQTRTTAQAAKWFAELLPAVLGILPLVALAGGLYESGRTPYLPALADSTVGAADLLYRQQLSTELGSLRLLALVVVGLSLLLFLGFAVLMRPLEAIFAAINEAYFKRWWLLPVSLGLVVVAAAFVYLEPVSLPIRLGVLGMLVLFMACLVAITVHLSSLSREYRWPLVALPVVLAIIFSVFDCNDNHVVRLIEPQPGQAPPAQRPPLAEDEFLTWFNARSAKVKSSGDFPVYVVAAQGGGIYAAYQTAIFLARMQDMCPAFKDHLFAISSVSGGSVGAAVFTAALHNVAAMGAAPSSATAPVTVSPPARDAGNDAIADQSIPAAAMSDPCPRVTAHLRERKASDLKTLSQPGNYEREVRRILSKDFLSPLIGSFLFTDFSQRFVPYPFGALDRARALEAGFEAAASPEETAGTGPLAQPFMRHWNALEGLGPALLINSTDAASGRRMVIAPFSIQSAFPTRRKASILTFPFWSTLENGVKVPKPLDIRLSTAAGISARFPWVTPAATVPATNFDTGETQPIRLVDGGYIDNSGVETALDLIHVLSAAVARVNLMKPPVNGEGAAAPAPPRAIKLQLISLSGGDYPRRDSYALGETLEPVRATFSAREARAHVAIERAGDEMPGKSPKLEDGTDLSSLGPVPEPLTISDLQVSKLASREYELPLGWSLGRQTRELIENQSGRFWQCRFGVDFQQTDPAGSEADCIQRLIYHQLHHSLHEEAASITKELNERPLLDGRRLRNDEFFGCYDKSRATPLTHATKRTLQAILTIWDQNPQWQDDRMLATLFGVFAHETGDFRYQEERLNYLPDTLKKRYPSAFPNDKAVAAVVGDRQKIANAIHGGKFGNREGDDGYRYRGRGLLQITGRDNYRNLGRAIGYDLEAERNSQAIRVRYATGFW